MTDQMQAQTVESASAPTAAAPIMRASNVRKPKPAIVESVTPDMLYTLPELADCKARTEKQMTAFSVLLFHTSFFDSNKASKKGMGGRYLDVTQYFPNLTPIKDALSMIDLQTEKIEKGWDVLVTALGAKVIKALPKDTLIIVFWSQRLAGKGIERRILWQTLENQLDRVIASRAILKLASGNVIAKRFESVIVAPPATGKGKDTHTTPARPDASALILG